MPAFVKDPRTPLSAADNEARAFARLRAKAIRPVPGGGNSVATGIAVNGGTPVALPQGVSPGGAQ
jgi:hypothetical protein